MTPNTIDSAELWLAQHDPDYFQNRGSWSGKIWGALADPQNQNGDIPDLLDAQTDQDHEADFATLSAHLSRLHWLSQGDRTLLEDLAAGHTQAQISRARGISRQAINKQIKALRPRLPWILQQLNKPQPLDLDQPLACTPAPPIIGKQLGFDFGGAA